MLSLLRLWPALRMRPAQVSLDGNLDGQLKPLWLPAECCPRKVTRSVYLKCKMRFLLEECVPGCPKHSRGANEPAVSRGFCIDFVHQLPRVTTYMYLVNTGWDLEGTLHVLLHCFLLICELTFSW
jgi:hypothetical protein